MVETTHTQNWVSGWAVCSPALQPKLKNHQQQATAKKNPKLRHAIHKLDILFGPHHNARHHQKV